MWSFLPSKHIEQLQQFNYRAFADIAESEFEDIRGRMRQLQSDEPLVSVVLIAYNEESYILATLASLSYSKVSVPTEFIVVNNNSTDDTQKFIDACGFISVFETKQGYAHARQAGLLRAKGKVVVTGDTDTLYKPDWVELLSKPILQAKANCTYSLHAFYTDDQKYPISLLLYQKAKYFGVLLKNSKRPHLNCGGASMAYSKADALAVGGYNPEVGRGEDGTLAFEIGRKGGKILLVSAKAAMIFTNMRRTQMDGNLGAAFLKRLLYHLRYFTHYFKKQTEH